VWRRVVERVVDRAGVNQVVTSEHDILDGIALSAARRS
jgi:exopolyphosphatase/guanosine-5'-triphosphate,3'-diphosphate pyrophosphatase